MRIKRIRLKNGYKRFHDLTIDLGDNPARIVALVGPNGCGKSSVLDGLLFHATAHERIGSGGNRDHTYHSRDSQPGFNHENVEIDLMTGTFSQARSKLSKIGKANTIFSFRSPYRYNARLKIDEVRAVGSILANNYGAGDASSIDAKMEENYRRIYAAVNAYLEENEVTLKQARAKIIGDLNDSIKNCLGLQISSIGNVEASKGTLYFKKPDHPTEFEFNVLSSGEKEVVDLLLDLYLRKEQYNDSVFMFDEPELHINTAIQGNLLKEIDKLVGENCQIWLTTHSIGFLRALQTEMKDRCQIIQFSGEATYASETFTLKPIKATANAWRDLFSIALDDLASLVSPRTIIYCEGRAEPGPGGSERGLDANVFNTVFGESHPDTLFTSSGGNTEPDQRSTIAIAILGKVFPGVEIIVLKDRDIGSGKIMNENDRQQYLKTNLDNHRVLRRYEIENYLYDKEVLKAYCQASNLTFEEASYDVFVTDIINQNVKDSTNHIRNFCGIKTSINADKFKLALAEHIVQGSVVFEELRACIFDRA